MWKKEYKNRFVPAGRIGRKDFLKNVIFIFVSLIGFTILGLFSSLAVVNAIGLFYALFLVYTLLCLYAKRMHDFGFRLWWLLLAIIIVEFVCQNLIMSSLSRQVSRALLTVILLIPFFKKGQGRANKFGDVV